MFFNLLLPFSLYKFNSYVISVIKSFAAICIFYINKFFFHFCVTYLKRKGMQCSLLPPIPILNCFIIKLFIPKIPLNKIELQRVELSVCLYLGLQNYLVVFSRLNSKYLL